MLNKLFFVPSKVLFDSLKKDPEERFSSECLQFDGEIKLQRTSC